MAWVPAAQAVLTVWQGPCQPWRIDTAAPGGVGHHHRHEERRDLALAAVHEVGDLLLEGAEAADAGGDEHAAASGSPVSSPA